MDWLDVLSLLQCFLQIKIYFYCCYCPVKCQNVLDEKVIQLGTNRFVIAYCLRAIQFKLLLFVPAVAVIMPHGAEEILKFNWPNVKVGS